MNHFWNIVIRPIIEAVNANYIVEIGSDSVNTRNILEYCEDNDAHMTAIDPFPNFDVDAFKTEYGDKFEIFTELSFIRLPLLKYYDVIILNQSEDYFTLYKELKTIEKGSLNQKFPIIFLLDIKSNFSEDKGQLDFKDESELYDNLNEDFDENNLEYNFLRAVEDFVDESNLDLSFELEDFNEIGIVYTKNEKLDEIVKKCMENLNLLNSLENQKIVLKEDIEKYKSEVTHLENLLDETRNEIEYNSNKYRSLTQRLISKFPLLYMLPRIHKNGIKNTLITRKGYHAIKNNELLDIGYYLSCNPDVKLTGQDPIIHYIYHGFNEGRKPNPTFDGEYYLETHSDVKNSNLNPLVHYGLYGINEKRNPMVKYNTNRTGSKKLMGTINFKGSNVLITGFLAIIGDYTSRKAIVKIDNEKFTVMCDEFSPELEKKGINEGYHHFTLNVPPHFMDGKKHTLRLFDHETGNLIARDTKIFFQPRRYRDLSGFLGNSLVSPMVYAPFREQDKRCFATMENVTKYLTNLSDKQKDLPLVSVIIPVYNSVDTLPETVDSVLNQSYSNVELIIVDGGSDDGSLDLLEKIVKENVIFIQNEECREVSIARNYGLKAANGKYIAYIDPGNKWDSRYLLAMVGAFFKLPDADAVYSGQLMFIEDQKHPFAVRFGSLNRSLLQNRNYIDLNAFCHTNDLYNNIGEFDESLGKLSDWDWIMRTSEDAQIYSIPVLLSNFYCKKDFINDNTQKVNDILRKKQAEIKNNNELKLINSSMEIKNKVSIIIPSYESLEDIRECIESILGLKSNNWFEIIVVDNNSSQPVIDYLSQLSEQSKIKLIKNDINYGFTYAVNQGIEIAEKGNDILLMNNDAMLTPGAIEAMQKAAYKLPDCGIVVPQQVLPADSKTLTEHVPYANPKYECDVNLSRIFDNIINIPLYHSGKVVELNFAPFFCVYIKNKVLMSSMGLDAEFGRHYRSDRIFCNYIRHVMNLKIYHVTDAVVYHKVQKATDILRESSQNDFDIMFHKNQWEDELASQFGYKKPFWDY